MHPNFALGFIFQRIHTTIIAQVWKKIRTFALKNDSLITVNNMSEQIKVISLFSGCGGLDLGFEQVGGYKTVWANDFKHEACLTFRKHFGDVILEGDIEQVIVLPVFRQGIKLQ